MLDIIIDHNVLPLSDMLYEIGKIFIFGCDAVMTVSHHLSQRAKSNLAKRFPSATGHGGLFAARLVNGLI